MMKIAALLKDSAIQRCKVFSLWKPGNQNMNYTSFICHVNNEIV